MEAYRALSWKVRWLRMHCSRAAQSFVHGVDCYANWTIMMPIQGQYEYRFTAGNEGDRTWSEQWDEVKQGDLVLCPPGTYSHRRSQEPLMFLFAEFVWEYDHDEDRSGVEIPCGRTTILAPGRLSSTLRLLGEAIAQEAEGQLNTYVDHLLNDLLYTLLKQAGDARMGSRLNDPLVHTAREQIRLLAGGPLSLGEIARNSGLSQSQFTRRFQAAVGMSPVIYLTRLRMQMVRNLLLETDLTLDEIAEQCGYQNGFYLSRVFARHYGIPPSAYRQSQRI